MIWKVWFVQLFNVFKIFLGIGPSKSVLHNSFKIQALFAFNSKHMVVWQVFRVSNSLENWLYLSFLGQVGFCTSFFLNIKHELSLVFVFRDHSIPKLDAAHWFSWLSRLVILRILSLFFEQLLSDTLFVVVKQAKLKVVNFTSVVEIYLVEN